MNNLTQEQREDLEAATGLGAEDFPLVVKAVTGIPYKKPNPDYDPERDDEDEKELWFVKATISVVCQPDTEPDERGEPKEVEFCIPGLEITQLVERIGEEIQTATTI